MCRFFVAFLTLLCGLVSTSLAADGNRLAYLDGPLDPYYPHRDFPKLITPQWVGDPGVECVVTLAIDDMRDTAKYEAYLRPILDRLKKIDGRAPVSIMTCKVDPADPQLQTWLKEGLSLECHTFDHPCPCLQDGGLAKAKETYDKCVDLMNQIPGNKPVAFRTPCCDSKNTPSPRLWAEVFSKTTAKGNFLQIDSSVMNIITSDDKSLPKEITTLHDGSERFLRYVPFKNFVNTIRDYPYPYVIGGTCWQFPCVTPSDWSAQHVQKPNNPDTIRDWKLALDAAVLKQGTFNLIFHPHGWIRSDQILELIDHAVTKHGKKVKFLNFRECAERLNRTFGELRNQEPKTQPQPAHALPSGVVFSPTQDTGLRFVDVNSDGKLDCLFSNAERYSLHLFKDMKEGWSIKVIDAVRGMKGGTGRYIPPFVRADGTNNGVWFHSGALWMQNEDTWRLPDGVEKVTFAELLASEGRQPPEGAVPEKAIPPDPPLSPRGRGAGGEGAAANEKPKPTSVLKKPDSTGSPSLTRRVSVGAAKVDITPAYPVRLSGYGARKTESQGIAQRIYARAVAIGGDEGDGPALIINAENCGIPEPMVAEVAKALLEKAKLPRERLVVCSTHTHSAPWIVASAPYLFGPLPEAERAHIDQYTKEVTAKLIEVANRALAARQPARLSWGQGKTSFAANRRVLKEGKWTGFGVTPGAPVDHSLPILAAHDETGKLLAVLVNYACHCTTLGGDFNEVAGDWAGFAQEYLEAEHRGAVAAVIIGCGADANPEPRGSKLELCQQHGRAIADEVNRLLAGKLQPLAGPLKCQLTHVELPFAPIPSKEEWQKKTTSAGVTGDHAKDFLARLEKGEKIDQPVRYPVAAWTFGDDLAMVFLGGEVVVDYSLRLKTLFDPDRLWITSYANAMPGYIASKRVLAEGGYEADFSMIYYGQPGRWADGVEDIIVQAVEKLLPGSLLAKPANPNRIDVPPPKSPDEALRSMHLRPEMKIELVAAEPLVVDPVAFDWGPDGRLWVVEMRDYPNGITWKKPGDEVGKPGGRVKVLTDTDGDGRYDKAALFLDDIPFPTGVKVWRKGIIVTAAPDIFYAADTTGDDVADERKVLYRGFGEGNQQHRVNGLRWGLDGWLYVGNGDSGGVIRAMGAVQGPKSKVQSRVEGSEVNVAGRDLRIRPDTGEIDAQSGQTQFGRERDDWGNWFGGNNSNPMWHYVLEDHYLRRNPHFAPPAVRKDVPQLPGAAPVFPRSKTLTRFNDLNKANRFTSACSPLIYRDDLLGPEFAGNSFVCEPVHNLVHREIVSPQGVSFTSRRAGDEQTSEFLASDDNWFRPSMIRTGPDGALWVADMYRFVIEHPKWIPDEFQQTLDLRAGDDRGRIYRIYHQDRQPRPIARLDKLDTAGLVAALDTPNGQQRDLVQQMLLWNPRPEAVEPLRALAAQAKRPVTRATTLATLAELNELTPAIAHLSLNDPDAGVRRHAVRLSTLFWGKLKGLDDALLALAGDDDPQVRLQVAYSLGEIDDPRAAVALGRLLAEASDPYLAAAAMSSVNKQNVSQVLTRVLAAEGSGPSASLVEQLLAVAAGLGNDAAVREALEQVVRPNAGGPQLWQLTALGGLLDMLERKKVELNSLIGGAAKESLVKLLAQAREIAAGEVELPGDTVPLRVAAIRLLGRGIDGQETDAKLLQSLCAPQQPDRIQSAAVAAVAHVQRNAAPAQLLAGWSSHTPSLRQQILDLLTSREEWSLALLAAVEQGKIPASVIDARRRQQFVTAGSAKVRARAEKVLAATVNADRQKLVATYLQATSGLSADATRGKAVFAKRCANCHKLEGVGHAVGPDLTALTNRSPDALLTAILDPNRAVEDKFLDFAVLLVDGRTATGLLREETGTSITLAGPEGKTATILRSEIDQLKSSGKSLMPEGVERDLPAAEMADLVAYLRLSGPPPKQLAGNTPELVKPYFDGSVRLFAMHARVYGPKIVFEEKYRNLGYWSSPEDHAAWSFESPGAGEYRVSLDYACAREAAGNRLVLTVAGQTLGGQVEGTGSWDDYRSQDLGVVTLPAGQSELLVRSDGAIKGALIDLRGIRLAPVKR